MGRWPTNSDETTWRAGNPGLSRLLTATYFNSSRCVFDPAQRADVDIQSEDADAEIRGLQWGRMDLFKAYLWGIARLKPAKAGTPVTGQKRPLAPAKPMVTRKNSWSNVKAKAKVTGRCHDNRHTLITDLAESGAGDETIRDIVGQVSKQMLKHYSHIRMEA